MQKYLGNPEKSRKLRLLFYDGLTVFLVFVLSYALRVCLDESGSILSLHSRMSWLVAVGVVIHLLTFYVFGLYESRALWNKKLLFINILLSVFSASVLLALASFAFPMNRIGRMITGAQFVLMVAVFYSWRLVYAKALNLNEGHNVVIVGWNAIVEKISDYLRTEGLGYKVAGVVVPQPEEVPAALGNPIPVFRCIDDALCRCAAKTIVITRESSRLKSFATQLLDLKFSNREIFPGPSFYERCLGRVPVSEISENWLLYGFREGAFQPRLYVKVKRLFDFFASGVVLILAFPLFLLAALLIRLDSKGPVFFKQERLGLNEVPFTLIKFRTMVDNAEEKTGPCWARENDSRFTRIGKFLRKTRLDEFPQFINVLKGDMSLVGPRPIRRHFANIFSEKFPYYRLRFRVKPGITGWAQVNMDYVNTEEDQYEKLEYEFYYLYHQSIFLDMFIVLKTVQSMLKMRGG